MTEMLPNRLLIYIFREAHACVKDVATCSISALFAMVSRRLAVRDAKAAFVCKAR